ncbi:MAG: exopolysaccharide biosynthesis protein [Phyllobacteriaceae bacterium]|nr:exopolysaccharide biosynthesis protein [Phyllobacteriaceae bacterium]
MLDDAQLDAAIKVLEDLGAFNCLPLPPGSSLISGIPCLMLSWQLMMRRKAAWLPVKVLELPVTESTVETVRIKLIPRLFWIEKFVKPRYWPMYPGQDEAIIGVVCALFSIVLIMPIPLGNWLPAFAIASLALALLQRDGVLLLIGIVISILAIAVLAFVGFSAVFLAESMFSGHLGALWHSMIGWF